MIGHVQPGVISASGSSTVHRQPPDALDRYTGSVRPSVPTIDLMQPKLVTRPFHRAGWVYEEKYDGRRMLAYRRGTQVQLVSPPGATTRDGSRG